MLGSALVLEWPCLGQSLPALTSALAPHPLSREAFCSAAPGHRHLGWNNSSFLVNVNVSESCYPSALAIFLLSQWHRPCCPSTQPADHFFLSECNPSPSLSPVGS